MPAGSAIHRIDPAYLGVNAPNLDPWTEGKVDPGKPGAPGRAAVVEHESYETFMAMHTSPVQAEAGNQVMPLLEGSPTPSFFEVVVDSANLSTTGSAQHRPIAASASGASAARLSTAAEDVAQPALREIEGLGDERGERGARVPRGPCVQPGAHRADGGGRDEPWRDVVGVGLLAFGSDWPVSSPDPLWQIHTAVNRMPPPGYPYLPAAGIPTDPFLPEERLDLPAAIAAATIGSAFVNHLERRTGTIEEGKLADLVVIDRNLFAEDVDAIGEAKVLLTLVEGEPVYEDAGL